MKSRDDQRRYHPREYSCLLDTGAVISHLRGIAGVTELLERLGEKGTLAVSPVTAVEVWQGTKEPEIERTRAFFTGVETVVLDEKLGEAAGFLAQRLRRDGFTIQLADAVIAATALDLCIPVLTTNARHFTLVPNLEVWDLKGMI